MNSRPRSYPLPLAPPAQAIGFIFEDPLLKNLPREDVVKVRPAFESSLIPESSPFRPPRSTPKPEPAPGGRQAELGLSMLPTCGASSQANQNASSTARPAAPRPERHSLTLLIGASSQRSHTRQVSSAPCRCPTEPDSPMAASKPSI